MRLLILAFKSSLYLNGIGTALVLALAIGALPMAISSFWLRLPLALFLAGIILSILGLFWSMLTQRALLRQLLAQQPRRMHYLPSLLACICYVLAVFVFAAGCWGVLGIVSVSQYYEQTHNRTAEGGVHGFRHP